MKTEMPINYDIEYPVLLRKYHELCNEFCGQRDAALKLADEILIHRVSPLLRDSEWVMGRMDGKRDVANKIRAIFEPKEEK